MRTRIAGCATALLALAVTIHAAIAVGPHVIFFFAIGFGAGGLVKDYVLWHDRERKVDK